MRAVENVFRVDVMKDLLTIIPSYATRQCIVYHVRESGAEPEYWVGAIDRWQYTDEEDEATIYTIQQVMDSSCVHNLNYVEILVEEGKTPAPATVRPPPTAKVVKVLTCAEAFKLPGNTFVIVSDPSGVKKGFWRGHNSNPDWSDKEIARVFTLDELHGLSFRPHNNYHFHVLQVGPPEKSRLTREQIKEQALKNCPECGKRMALVYDPEEGKEPDDKRAPGLHCKCGHYQPLPGTRQCYIEQVLHQTIVEGLRQAPNNAQLRTQVLAALTKPIPEEAKTFEQVTEWVEYNFHPGMKGITMPKSSAPPVTADNGQAPLILQVRYTAEEIGRCDYTRRRRFTGPEEIPVELLAECARDSSDISGLVSRLLEQCRNELDVNWFEQEEVDYDTENHDGDIGNVRAVAAGTDARERIEAALYRISPSQYQRLTGRTAPERMTGDDGIPF